MLLHGNIFLNEGAESLVGVGDLDWGHRCMIFITIDAGLMIKSQNDDYSSLTLTSVLSLKRVLYARLFHFTISLNV